MISELLIENIALIPRLSISFKNGFNVLSGETGAGKSIIVDAVNLILGSRADKELIRSGAQSAYVEAQIDLSQRQQNLPVLEKYGISGEELIVSRSLSQNGKNVCRINGHLVNLATLKEVMSYFVDIYGQNQNVRLLDEENHLKLIDAYGADEIAKVKSRAEKAYAAYHQIKQELNSLQNNASQKARLLDLLSYQIEEIERAALKVDEEEQLLGEKKVMQNAERIAEALNHARSALLGEHGAVGGLYEAMHSMQQIANLDPAYARIEKILSDAYYGIDDASDELSKMSDGVFYDAQRLNQIETRLIEISALKRKYGPTILQILEFQTECQKQLEQLQDSDDKTKELECRLAVAKQQMEEIFDELTRIRQKAASELGVRLTKELADLGMKDAVLQTEFLKTGYSAEGWDSAFLLISVNKGTPPRRLAKIASGGEISRVILAIKNIVAENEAIDTMIFDEIDTGISGNMAQIVAKKIANISRERQVICVTHLPQIAAMGDANFYIEKKEENGVVFTSIKPISGDALEIEIARLSGGLQSQTARRHAKELLANALSVKQQISFI